MLYLVRLLKAPKVGSDGSFLLGMLMNWCVQMVVASNLQLSD
jgi:hypothetical protein